MVEYKLLPLLLIFLATIATWALVKHLGGRTGRQYAVSIAGVVLFFGIDRYYDLPWYSYLAALVIASFLYHRSVRGTLVVNADRLALITLPELGLRLRKMPDLSGKFVALWRGEPIPPQAAPIGTSPAAAPQSPAPGGDAGPAKPNAKPAGPAPDAMVVGLEFIGESEDEYAIILHGESPRELPAEVVVHDREGEGRFLDILENAEAVNGLPGQGERLAVRSSPKDFAFRLLGQEAFSILGPIFNLRTEEREIYVHVDGRNVRIGSSRTFNAEELGVFISMGARWIAGVRAASLQMGR